VKILIYSYNKQLHPEFSFEENIWFTMNNFKINSDPEENIYIYLIYKDYKGFRVMFEGLNSWKFRNL
jgi:hypothetical protein